MLNIKTMKTFKTLTIIGILALSLNSFTSIAQEPWKVPEKYENMKNPTDPKVDLAIGKSLYSKHCKSCHGKEGYGDGPKADELDGELGDFTTEDFQKQSDGALYYKSIIGRDDMPEFTKKITEEEDRWLIINYLRTLEE
jgi:mono/diheme cytochrome c family protein